MIGDHHTTRSSIWKGGCGVVLQALEASMGATFDSSLCAVSDSLLSDSTQFEGASASSLSMLYRPYSKLTWIESVRYWHKALLLAYPDHTVPEQIIERRRSLEQKANINNISDKVDAIKQNLLSI